MGSRAKTAVGKTESKAWISASGRRLGCCSGTMIMTEVCKVSQNPKP